jgi:hypothetical protein
LIILFHRFSLNSNYGIEFIFLSNSFEFLQFLGALDSNSIDSNNPLRKSEKLLFTSGLIRPGPNHNRLSMGLQPTDEAGELAPHGAGAVAPAKISTARRGEAVAWSRAAGYGAH